MELAAWMMLGVACVGGLIGLHLCKLVQLCPITSSAHLAAVGLMQIQANGGLRNLDSVTSQKLMSLSCASMTTGGHSATFVDPLIGLAKLRGIR